MSHRRLARLLSFTVSAALLGLVASVSVTAPSAAEPSVAAAKDPAMAKRLTRVMSDSRVRGATSAAVVLDAATGAELYARYGSRGTTPASNTKVFTAAAAMKTLGPKYQFKTEVIRRATLRGGVLYGRLYLKGFGDPTTRPSDFASLARQVKAQGIRRVRGSLVADASFFDNVRYNANWSKGYATDYYAAQISALTVASDAAFDSGTVLLHYGPGTKGHAAKVTATPAAAARYVRIVNKTTTGARGTSPAFSARRAPNTNTITVRGRVPAGRSRANKLITINRPDLYAAAVFRAELRKVGVTVDQKTIAMATPAGSRRVLARDRSMTLSHVLVPFLKLSNNMVAEALTKTMGTRKGRPGNWTDGIDFTLAYLRSKAVPMAGVRLVDGSGLTRNNKITPRAMGTLLYRIQKEKWFQAFYAALPVAGNRARMTGGTLRNRLVGTAAANNAHAKTGSLTGVTALSGYVRGADGHRYIFSMLSQYKSRSPRPVENTLVLTLARWRR